MRLGGLGRLGQLGKLRKLDKLRGLGLTDTIGMLVPPTAELVSAPKHPKQATRARPPTAEVESIIELEPAVTVEAMAKPGTAATAETPIELEPPAKADVLAGLEAPAKVGKPVVLGTPAEAWAPAKPGTTPAGGTPATPGAPIEVEPPAKANTPAKAETAPKPGAVKVPIERKAPGKTDPPAPELGTAAKLGKLNTLSRQPTKSDVERVRRWALPAAGVAVAVLAVAVGTTRPWNAIGAQDDDAPSAGAPGWEPVFVDDFTGAEGGLPATENWAVAVGSMSDNPPGGTSGEVQTGSNAPANLATDGQGNLAIVPVRDAAGRWTSARIETKQADLAAPDRGVLRVESRIQLPDLADSAAASGYWPAFRAIGSPARENPRLWPSVGHVDVVESVNGEDLVRGSLHCGSAQGGPCNEPTGMTANRACPDQACAGNFHTYSFEWDRTVSPNQLRWLVDGQEFFRVDQDAVDVPTWEQITGHGGYFLVLGVAMGGRLPDGVAGGATPTVATASGEPMLVDYVAVWTRGAAGSGRQATAPEPPDEQESAEGPTAGDRTTATAATTTTAPTTTTTAPTTTTAAAAATAPPATTAPATTAPPAPPPGRDPYATTMAVDYDGQAGTGLEATNAAEGSGSHVGFIDNGNWLRYDDVDFGATGPSGFAARVASGVHEGAYGTLRVRVDSPSGPDIAAFNLASTGGWFSWTTASASTTAVTGRHTLYFVFTSPQAEEFMNLRWFRFS